MKTHYVYSVEGHTYWLYPVFKVSKSGFVRVVAAQLWSPHDGQFFGILERYNMPTSVVLGLESLCRLAVRHALFVTREDGLLTVS